ncbi:MAG TPA: formyl transferase, partial [Sphingomonas sp.]|nr:formyl transferase [Sphingomonas sp.]
MGLRKDIWRSAIVEAPLGEIVRRGSIDGLPLRWLPSLGSFRFLADPFGLWCNGQLHVFAEAYDYRVRIGTIEVFTYSASLDLVSQQTALVEPWHLSYPLVIAADGQTWMLPEAHRSGSLTLYRAVEFPGRWEA